MRKLQVAVCLIVTLLFPASLRPQERKFTERVEVVLVEIPVTVVDRGGNSVRGLTAANFQLVDDGKKRDITFFEAINVAEVQAKHPSGVRGEGGPINPAARRNFTLLFDLSSSNPGYIARSRDAAMKFVDAGMQPLDLAAVATFSVEQGVRFLTTFTTDRKLLQTAVSNMGRLKSFQMGDPLLLFPTQSDLGLASSRTRGEREEAVIENFADMNRGMQRNDDDYRRARISRQLQSFSNFARQLDKLRGDKQVILLSEGFDAKLIQGREQTGSQDGRDDAAAVLSGEVWKVDNDNRFGNAGAANDLQRMVGFFRRSNVVLHALDVKGVRTGVDARAGATISSGSFTGASTESLFLMANGTGGQVFKNTNDLSEGFERLLKQQEVVYVLGFQAPAGGNRSRFHNVKVKLVGAPSGVKVHHRAGYYEAGPMSSIEQALSATEIMMNDIPQEDFTMHVISSPFPVPGSRPQVPVIVEIAGDKLGEGVVGNQLNGELMIYAFDDSNAVKDFLYQKMSLDLSKIGGTLKQSGVKYYGTLSLPPGNYAVRTLFKVTETGRSAYRRVDLKVPDFQNAVILSPFVVEPPGQWIMVKGASRTETPVGYPFFMGEESFIPSAMPALRSEQEYKVALFTYNLPAETLQLNAKVRDGQGSVQSASLTLKGRTPPDAEGGTKLLFAFSPTGLMSGSYALDFSVQRKDSTGTELFSIPFVIR